MTPDEERLARAALLRIAECGDRELGELVATFGPGATLAGIRQGTVDARGLPAWQARLPLVRPEQDLEAAERIGARLICPGESEWPSQLDDLDCESPLGLYVRGPDDLRLAAVRSVAVVGARAATSYGNHVAGELAAGVAERGWTVVSGGAFGIDAAAHRGALAVGGSTVSVLASGLDITYPRGHEPLLDRIAEEGWLVSEVPPGVAPSRFRFLVRNRLIAALTRGTVVVEAARRSGSLRTAKNANDLGRVLMGVPGPITSGLSAGVHHLLRTMGGVLVTSPAEIVDAVGLIGEDLAPATQGPRRKTDGLSAEALRVFEALPAKGPAPVERLAVTAGLPATRTLAELGGLALSGLVERVDGGWRLSRRTRG